MSIIVSDADVNRRQESMIATSKVNWCKPQTFGSSCALEVNGWPSFKQSLDASNVFMSSKSLFKRGG